MNYAGQDLSRFSSFTRLRRQLCEKIFGEVSL